MLRPECEAPPVLNPRQFLVGEAGVQSHSSVPKSLDRLSDEIWHAADHAASSALMQPRTVTARSCR